MLNYATLFDKNYLSKGLVLHDSLMRHASGEWQLTILAMDDDAFRLLAEMNLTNVDLIPLCGFERAMNLEPQKQSRSWAEFCYTSGSNLIEYLLPWVQPGEFCCYVDADVRFFSDPRVIFDEIADRSIGIVPHRFNERERARLAKNGEMNVGIVAIRNTAIGQKCVSAWAKDCRDWCFAKNDGPGRFADQGYLDFFERDYGEEVAVIQNLGVNLGPWSIGNFEISERDGNVFVNNDKLVAYHYHEYIHGQRLTNWQLRPTDVQLIYEPYVQDCDAASLRAGIATSAIRERQQTMQLQSERA